MYLPYRWLIPLLLLMLLCGAAWGYVWNPQPNEHRCHAPCTVVLPHRALEDEFWFDYGWEDANTSVVRLYYCKGEVHCYKLYNQGGH